MMFWGKIKNCENFYNFRPLVHLGCGFEGRLDTGLTGGLKVLIKILNLNIYLWGCGTKNKCHNILRLLLIYKAIYCI